MNSSLGNKRYFWYGFVIDIVASVCLIIMSIALYFQKMNIAGWRLTFIVSELAFVIILFISQDIIYLSKKKKNKKKAYNAGYNLNTLFYDYEQFCNINSEKYTYTNFEKYIIQNYSSVYNHGKDFAFALNRRIQSFYTNKHITATVFIAAIFALVSSLLAPDIRDATTNICKYTFFELLKSNKSSEVENTVALFFVVLAYLVVRSVLSMWDDAGKLYFYQTVNNILLENKNSINYENIFVESDISNKSTISECVELTSNNSNKSKKKKKKRKETITIKIKR